MSQSSSTIRERISIAYLTHPQEAILPSASPAGSVFSQQRNTSSRTSFPSTFSVPWPSIEGRDGGEVSVEGRGETQMRDEEVRPGVKSRGEDESIEDEEVGMYDTTPSSPTFSLVDTVGRPLLGGARLPPRQQPAPRRRDEAERTGDEEVETPHAAPSSPTFSPAAMVGRPLLGGARLQPPSSHSRTQHRAQLPPPISAMSSRSQPRAMAQELTPAASGSVIIFVDPWARDRQKLAEEARERASWAQWRRTVGGFEASTNANVDVEAGVDLNVEAGVDAQVEGRPRKRSRTPERSASEPKNEGDHICAVCHHPLAPGTPPHIHLPPIRSQLDAWSAAALDGAAIMQPDSPASPVFAPGSVGDHMQRMEPIRSLSPPRPSHRRPSYSDPFLAQVSETLHRAPQGYPTPPISPTPSEWFRNRPVGDLPRAPHFPRDASPFLAQVTETLHRDRRRSPDTYPSPSPGTHRASGLVTAPPTLAPQTPSAPK